MGGPSISSGILWILCKPQVGADGARRRTTEENPKAVEIVSWSHVLEILTDIARLTNRL